MSLFGEQLRAVIDANKVNIYHLAKTTGLERTAIHKIISGDRIPSDEYVYRLTDALQLSPEERQRLLESFNISKIGESKYWQRIQVKDLIESIAYIENGISSHADTESTAGSPPLDENSTVAIGHFAVNNLIKSVVEEAASGEKQELNFVIPESYQFFYNELLACYLSNPKLRIRHIVAFSKKVDFMNNRNGNLSLLSHVLPFAFAPGAGYFPYYYYRASSDVDLTQAMPFFILTSRERLVVLNKDFSRAGLICDAGIIALYKESFSAMLERAKPLINRLNSTFDFYNHITDIVGDTEMPEYWIEPTPCFSLLITGEIINEYLKPDVPDREGLVKMLSNHCDFFRESKLHVVNICTTDGLYRVINSGYINNFPPELMDPLRRETMKDMLISLINRIKDGEVKILFANPSMIAVPGKIQLIINRRSEINFLVYDNDSMDGHAICLSEDSINEAFFDFAENIEGSGLVYSESDSLATLQSIIDEL